MNLYRALPVTLWLLAQASAAATGFSLATNGISLVVTSWRSVSSWQPSLPDTNAPIYSGDKLVWMAFCKGGKDVLWYPLDPAYFFKVRMYDSQGKEVPRTALGKSYGSKFDQLRSYKTTRLQPIQPEGSYEENYGRGGGESLPPAKDLFKMKKEGIYTMVIEMQMFRYVKSTNVDDWSKNLIRFSPIKVKVTKDLES